MLNAKIFKTLDGNTLSINYILFDLFFIYNIYIYIYIYIYTHLMRCMVCIRKSLTNPIGFHWFIEVLNSSWSHYHDLQYSANLTVKLIIVKVCKSWWVWYNTLIQRASIFLSKKKNPERNNGWHLILFFFWVKDDSLKQTKREQQVQDKAC